MGQKWSALRRKKFEAKQNTKHAAKVSGQSAGEHRRGHISTEFPKSRTLEINEEELYSAIGRAVLRFLR
jgi:hypothetical protein